MTNRTFVRVSVAAVVLLAVACVVVRSNRTTGPKDKVVRAYFEATSPAKVVRESAEDGTPVGRKVASSDFVDADATPAKGRIRTIDESGAPVPDVEVFVEYGDEIASVGRTDGGGVASVSERSVERATGVVGRADGFVRQSAPMVARDGFLATIVMRRGAKIRGVVRLPDGNPPPESAFVVASPVVMSPVRGSGDALAHPSHLTARTNAAGEFEFDAVDPQLKYGVVAVGADAAGVHDATVSSADQNFVVNAYYLYRAVVRVREEGGRECRSDPRLYRSGESYSFGRGPGDAVQLDFREPCVALWQRTNRRAEGAASRAVFSGQFANSRTAQRPGEKRVWSAWYMTTTNLDSFQTQFRLRLPGYRPISATVTAVRASADVVNEVVAPPLAASFGALTVETTTDVSMGDIGRCELGTLLLFQQTADTDVAYDLQSTGPTVIAGVPTGSYRWSFEGPGGFFRRNGSVVVGEDAAAVVRIDLSGAGFVVLSVASGPATPAIETLSVEVSPFEDRPNPLGARMAVVSMLTGPFAFGPMEPGRYDLRVSAFDVGGREPVDLGSFRASVGDAAPSVIDIVRP